MSPYIWEVCHLYPYKSITFSSACLYVYKYACMCACLCVLWPLASKHANIHVCMHVIVCSVIPDLKQNIPNWTPIWEKKMEGEPLHLRSLQTPCTCLRESFHIQLVHPLNWQNTRSWRHWRSLSGWRPAMTHRNSECSAWWPRWTAHPESCSQLDRRTKFPVWFVTLNYN